MSGGWKHFLVYVMAIVVVLLSFASGCAQGARTTDSVGPSSASDVQSPATFQPSFPNGAPPLGRVARFIVVLTNRTLGNVLISVDLSEGFELASGNLSWSSDALQLGDTKVIDAEIKAVRTGNWTIRIQLETASKVTSASFPVFVSVAETSAQWGLEPPWFSDVNSGSPVPVIK